MRAGARSGQRARPTTSARRSSRGRHELAASTAPASKCVVGTSAGTRTYPMIHAVGRARARAPRLIDLRWGGPTRRASRWSARACASTPAVSTSSPRRHAADEEGHGRRGVCARRGTHADGGARRRRAAGADPGGREQRRRHAYRPGDVLRSRKGLTSRSPTPMPRAPGARRRARGGRCRASRRCCSISPP
jgi:hypothetical protein